MVICLLAVRMPKVLRDVAARVSYQYRNVVKRIRWKNTERSSYLSQNWEISKEV